MINGFDTSRYEMWTGFHDVVKLGYLFGATCATQGDYLVDPTFNGFKENPDGILYGEYWKKFKEAKVLRVAYHVLSPDRDVDRQMDAFFRVLEEGGYEDDDRVCLDDEISRGCEPKVITQKTYGCLKIMERRTLKQALLYTAPSWGSRNLLPDDYIMSHDLWIANYENPNGPALPKIFTKWLIWQWTEGGVLPGTREKIDLNYFNGDLAALYAFFGRELPPSIPDDGGTVVVDEDPLQGHTMMDAVIRLCDMHTGMWE